MTVMMQADRSKREKNIVTLVPAIALLFIAVGSILGVLSAQEMRKTVIDQFNDEQMVVARNIKRAVEKEVRFLEREIALLADEIARLAPGSPLQNDKIRQCHSRLIENGVWKIQLIDVQKHTALLYIPFKSKPLEQPAQNVAHTLERIRSFQDQKVLISPARKRSNGLVQTLGVSVGTGNRYFLLFHVNLSWLLSPLLRDIRSGKTGYAWIIDEKGHFLYHPDISFVGKDAFSIRENRYPDLSFGKINFIQKEKMLKGCEGTGSYTSGWHRGNTGKISKLIAYCPIVIADSPLQRWSVAVVAPVAEIEAAVKRGYLQQFLLQGLMIAAVVLGALSLLLLEKRWSRRMEEMVVKRTEAYKRSEEKYRSLIESAEDFIFTADLQGHLKSMNSFMARFFDGRPQDFLDKHLSNLLDKAAAKKQLHLIQTVARSGRSVRDEFELKRADRAIWINANFMPLKNKSGQVTAVLCIARDITENKNLERQLVNTEKLASLGTLAAGVAHEVNNPLGVILGFCDLLLEKTDKNSQNFKDLKTIERQGLHCKQVVENLLSFSRTESTATDSADVNACLNEILSVVRHTLEMNRITLVNDPAQNIPPVRGDKRQLQQVFLNLINNAVAAMDDGGRLAIHTRFDPASLKAAITFADNGKGITAEHMDHIFEPFFTTKPEGEGTGLGLFVSYGIITKYGGSIECTGSTQNGQAQTTFRIQLPIKGRETK